MIPAPHVLRLFHHHPFVLSAPLCGNQNQGGNSNGRKKAQKSQN
jgi:hypothetical protein